MGTLKQDALDFIYEHTNASTDAQLTAADGLDSKAFQSLGASSIVLGLSALIPDSGPNWVGYIIVAAVLSYIVVAALVFYAVRIARFRSSLHADTFMASVLE